MDGNDEAGLQVRNTINQLVALAHTVPSGSEEEDELMEDY